MIVNVKISQAAHDKEQKPREIKYLEAENFFTDALREIVSSYEEDFPGIVHKYNAEYIESYKKLYVNDELFDLLTKVNDFMLKTARQY